METIFDDEIDTTNDLSWIVKKNIPKLIIDNDQNGMHHQYICNNRLLFLHVGKPQQHIIFVHNAGEDQGWFKQ